MLETVANLFLMAFAIALTTLWICGLANSDGECHYAFDLDSLIIGRIVDVDIVFIHYATFEDAKEKWNRRRNRINFDNLLVKMNDQNNCTEKDLLDFLALEYDHKLFFTGNEKWKDYDGVFYLAKYKNAGYVVNDTAHGDVPINTTSLLNSLIR